MATSEELTKAKKLAALAFGSNAKGEAYTAFSKLWDYCNAKGIDIGELNNPKVQESKTTEASCCSHGSVWQEAYGEGFAAGVKAEYEAAQEVKHKTEENGSKKRAQSRRSYANEDSDWYGGAGNTAQGFGTFILVALGFLTFFVMLAAMGQNAANMWNNMGAPGQFLFIFFGLPMLGGFLSAFH